MKIKKNVLIILVIVIIVLLIMFLTWVLSPKVKFKDVEVSLNSEYSNLDVVESVKKGKIITDKESIDTSNLGDVDIELKIKNILGITKRYKTKVKVVDKEAPTIEFKNILTTPVGKEIDLLNGVSATDNSKEDIKVYAEGEYDFKSVGDYKLYYVAKDSSGNTKKEEFTLKVIKSNTNETYFTTSKGFSGVTKNGITYIDGYLVVNKTYSLPKTFGSGLTKETMDAFNKLKSAALLDGFDIYIASGFRSYDRQVTLYNNYVKRDGKVAADTYSARPGHSEHQSGLTFDVNEVSDKFHDMPEAKWLHENCYKYGFILRFPKGKEEITGFKYESWHFRYVGEELAKKLYNNGDWLSMEEYFGISSVYEDQIKMTKLD